MAEEVIFVSNEHKTIVTWDRAFGGHPTELTIRRYKAWAEVGLTGGGQTGEWARLIHSCPVEVLRRIVAMHDALPPLPSADAKGVTNAR